MKAFPTPYGASRYLPLRAGGTTAVIVMLGTACAVAVTHFLAARLGLILLSELSDVAVFWPASGVSAGILVTLGRRARPAVALGVMVGTIAANLMGDGGLWAAALEGLCNAGETVLVAWLLDRWFGRAFAFCDLRHVAGFLVAAGLAAAISGVGGAAATTLLHATAPFWEVWRTWFLAEAVGIVVVAPLVIGLGQSRRQRPAAGEPIEAAGVLLVLASASALVAMQPAGSWLTFSPVAVVLPLLLWLAARHQSTFAIAGALVVSLTIIAATAFGVGRFGDAGVPIVERVRGAQTAVTMVTVYTLVLAALFSERRSREVLLEGRNERLLNQEAAFRGLLGALPAAIYTTDKDGYITFCNKAAVGLWGASPELGKDKWSDLWRLHYPDGTSVPLDERPTQICLREGRAVRGREALLERPDGTFVPIMPCPAPLIDERGTVIGVVNMQIDISERKRAEAALAERDAQLTLASKVARVGSYVVDCSSGIVRLSPGCAAIYGLPEGTLELSRADGRACVYPEDLAALDAQFNQACTEQHRELVVQFRIVRASDGEVRWIEARNLIAYDAGRLLRIAGIGIDVTERKQAEASVKESESRLADALAAGEVIAFEWDAVTRRSRRSGNAAVILGYEQKGSPSSQCFLGQIHPDDRESFKTHIRELCPDNPSYALNFRFCSPDGRHVWLEETAKGEFDAEGRLLRIRGLTRNITERKEAEHALAERNMQLSLAAKAALVGSYAYDPDTKVMQVSDGYAALHGLPEATVRTTGSAWQNRVHPEDLDRVEGVRAQAFSETRGEYGVEYRVVLSTGEVRWIESRSFISYRPDGRPQRVVGVNIDVSERKRGEDRQRILTAELDHRAKNILATVSAVAAHTLDTSSSMEDFVAALDGRIRSMAATHELLSSRRWQGIPLSELLWRQLAPYATNNNTNLDGPEVLLSAEAGQTIAMVLHELTTNAAKYGALSRGEGQVSVRWYRPRNGNVPDRVVIAWEESGGPSVQAPRRSGYGTSVISELVPYELGGRADLAFRPEGVRCRLGIPGKWVVSEHRPKEAKSERTIVEAVGLPT